MYHGIENRERMGKICILYFFNVGEMLILYILLRIHCIFNVGEMLILYILLRIHCIFNVGENANTLYF
jgi:hypothetical protein